MKKVTVFCQKGGSGKTSIVANLAAMAAARHLKVAIFDLDPQGSVSIWGDVRNSEANNNCNLPEVAVVPVQYPRLEVMMKTCESQRVDLILIDLPPKASDAAMAACDVSDICLIPCVPEIYDMAALPLAVKVARAASLEPHVVLNKVPQMGSERADAIQIIADSEYRAVPHVMLHRKPVAQAQAKGMSVEEFASFLHSEKRVASSHWNAAGEMEQIYNWTMNTLGLPSKADHLQSLKSA